MLKANDVEKNTIKTTFNKSSIFTKIILPENINEKDEISVLGLPRRIENSLLNYNIYSIGEFCNYCDLGELLHVRNIGPNTYKYLLELRKNLDFKFNSEINKADEDNKNITNITILKSFIYKGESLGIDDNVNSLGLPVRIENALLNGGVQTIRELYDYSSDDLYRLKNIGKETVNLVNDIKNSLIPVYENNKTDLVRDGLQTTEEKVTYLGSELLIDKLLLACRDERINEVVKKRFGLITGEKYTLEEIGKEFHITRERVRQLQVKGRSRLIHPSVSDKKIIIEQINEILWEYNGLISAEEADEIMPRYFNNFTYDGSSVLDLLSYLGWIQMYNIGDLNLYAPKQDNIPLPKLVNKTEEILKNSEHDLNVDEISQKITDISLENEILVGLILKICKLDTKIKETSSGKYTSYLIRDPRKFEWITCMEKVLDKEGCPLHFTEITDKVNDLLGSTERHLEVRRVHSLLIELPQFAHTGARGMYGLTKWGLRKESTLDLATECIKQAGVPVNWNQIYYYISKYKDTKKQNIKLLLESNARFSNTGDGKYWIN